MLKSLSTIGILLVLTGCDRFDEAKVVEECRKAHPNDQAAVEKCLHTASHAWSEAHAWLPRVVNRRDQMP